MGPRRRNIDLAIGRIEDNPDIVLKRVSAIYETDPVGPIEQGKFLNGVMEVETSLSPESLLKELNVIEEALGRKRTVKNGPRTIDLDILYYGDEIVNEDELIIPHPRINEREFVLKGLRELNRA